MAKTYQELASENLAAFGWTMSADEIPNLETCKKAMNGVLTWYNDLDDRTRAIIDDSDVSAGLVNQGFFTDWPALATCFKSSTVGWFASTFDDLLAALVRAEHAVGEQSSEPVSDVSEVVGDTYNPETI
jgi:hypothetical protein